MHWLPTPAPEERVGDKWRLGTANEMAPTDVLPSAKPPPASQRTDKPCARGHAGNPSSALSDGNAPTLAQGGRNGALCKRPSARSTSSSSFSLTSLLEEEFWTSATTSASDDSHLTSSVQRPHEQPPCQQTNQSCPRVRGMGSVSHHPLPMAAVHYTNARQ